MNTDIQYKGAIKKGDTVIYGNQRYRVQDDGKGFLHIVVTKPVRKKVSIESLSLAEPGTEADYVFNGWFLQYDYETYLSFTQAEMAWLN